MKKLMLSVLCAVHLTALSADPGATVLVIYNTEVKASKEVAEHYAKARSVPEKNIIGLSLPATETISRDDYQSAIVRPLLKETEKRKILNFKMEPATGVDGKPAGVKWKLVDTSIRYVLLCYGVPSRILKQPTLKEDNTEKLPAELKRNEASVDSELALLPLYDHKLPLTGILENKLYNSTNPATLHGTNGILMVTRLDAPTPEIAKGLVDKALEAEKNGLWGRAYFDIRNITNNYKMGDDWMRTAGSITRTYGYETVADTGPDVFPATFPMSQIAFYTGWYADKVSGPLAADKVEFMPGAFAYHLHSFNAHSIRTSDNWWVGPLLAKGVTITMGSVDEPYLAGTPDLAAFYRSLIFGGTTFGEASTICQSVFSWQSVAIGDPLYRPFGKRPQQLHEELSKSKSPMLEWSHAMVVNLNVVKGYPTADVIDYLEKEPLTQTSAILSEKLADLYVAQKNTNLAIKFYQKALTIKPSTMQKLRLVLTLTDYMGGARREGEAYDYVKEYVEENPRYAGNNFMYKWLVDVGNRLQKKEDVARFEKLLKDFKP